MLQKSRMFRSVALATFLVAGFHALPASAGGVSDNREVARAQILGTWRGEPVTSAAVVDGNVAVADRARQVILGRSVPARSVPLQGLARASLEQQELARRQILGLSTASPPAGGAVAAAR